MIHFTSVPLWTSYPGNHLALLAFKVCQDESKSRGEAKEQLSEGESPL